MVLWPGLADTIPPHRVTGSVSCGGRFLVCEFVSCFLCAIYDDGYVEYDRFLYLCL